MKGCTKFKYEGLVNTLRRQIMRGDRLPSEQLPMRTELCEEFNVSMITVQRALDELARDGFVQAKPGAGTFVAEYPPHLCSYGLVTQLTEQWSRYYLAVRNAIKSVETGDTVRFREYSISHEVNFHTEMLRLCGDVQRHRLAGLFFTGTEFDLADLKGTPILDEPGIARVLFSYLPEFGIPMTIPDESSFLDRSLEYVFSKGRRRVAHLCMDFSWVHLDEFEASLSQRGAEVRPYWIQPIPAGPIFRGAANVVSMMMQLEGDKRPDALIIHDDNLVEHAVAGLIAAGVKVPEEIEVVAKCNFPSPVSFVLPIRHLGPDFRMVIKEGLRVIEMQRSGQTPPMMTKIPAMFKDEITSESPAN